MLRVELFFFVFFVFFLEAIEEGSISFVFAALVSDGVRDIYDLTEMNARAP
jgi:hypothetical protein